MKIAIPPYVDEKIYEAHYIQSETERDSDAERQKRGENTVMKRRAQYRTHTRTQPNEHT